METAQRVMIGEQQGNIDKDLFQRCMSGKWEQVVEIYKKNNRAHTALITRAEDSALHVAVTYGQEEVVSQLVELLVQQQTAKMALKIQNKRGNTALHFAASMGTVKMIDDIAKADDSLVSVRNVDGETPLFLAAFHGRKDAFMILHFFCREKTGKIPIEYCRRDDGDTILHCAIAAENFDLAFQIIHNYKDLVNLENENGATPLHLLASKPSAFRRGSHLGRLETLIYYGISVKELKLIGPNYCQQLLKKTDKGKNNYPNNYQCVDLARLMKKAVLVVYRFPLTNYLNKKFLQKDQTQTQTQRGVDLEAPEDTAAKVETNSSGSKAKAWSFAANYKGCVDFVKFVFVLMLVIFGKGPTILTRMRRKKEKHLWSIQVMDELLPPSSTMYEYEGSGDRPEYKNQDHETSPFSVHERGSDSITSDSIMEENTTSITAGEADHQQNQGDKRGRSSKVEMETPILIAAKNGITEIVGRILELFPVAVLDMDANKKNIVLLAVENRQTNLYELLLRRKDLCWESQFRKVDSEANSVLHLAAKLGDHRKPWRIPGAMLQMHWEIKWYFFVKESMPPHFFSRYNKYNQTPREIFVETHKELAKSGEEWLKRTSESCSVVAALIATLSFATSTTVPGGVREENGIPTLEHTLAFKGFAMASLIALCFSVTALVLFLSILTSRYQEYDFGKVLPRKVILGLTSLFLSVVYILASFCAGHFLILRNRLEYVALPIYAVTCLPVMTLFVFVHFPLYFDLIRATFKKVPQNSLKTARLKF